jgi:DNA-binding NtrC family response regulator
MDGVQLATHILAGHPGARVLLMSGYDESRSPGTIGGQPVPRMRKPFTATALAHAVRNVLDATLDT